ncbi:hypothetical protein BG005_005679 [Podila minutissima]|nr:hypothetical protein BG005_005679 [Podila minutissima]
MIFRVPPPVFQVNGMDMYRNKVVATDGGQIEANESEKSNRIMYIMFFGNSIAGLVFLSHLANIIKDIFGKDEATAATIVAINGGFNLGGRLFFSTISGCLGRKNAFFAMLASQVVILGSLPTIMEKRVYWAFLLVIWILTSCYGGGFGCIPAFLCDMFGPSNIGALHGIILTA